MNEAEKNKAKYIKGCCAIFQKPPKILHAKISTIKSIDKKILYVASSSLPHQTTGYTTRTHAILKGICANGWDVTCTTRPGYPFDRNDLSVKYSDGVYELDGIIYEFLKGKGRRETPLDEYIYESAEILKKEMIQKCPSIVHAASNYEAGLPALIAAKELGIPFIYEVRGFWEYTSASKIEEWEKTERFALDYQLEALVAQNADLVITLNMAMADELVLRGVRREKIVFAPNALDIEKFYPVTKSNILAEKLGLKDDDFVIGYIGSIVNYEGLDTLIEAFCKVCQKIQNAKLLIVGNGKILSGLEKLAASFNVSDKVSFTGAVAHKDVQQYFSLINAITIPRKPHKVCQLVSPLKPLEAMGMEIPLIVSDVSALKEMVKDEQTGLIHKTDDPDSLAEAILRLAQNPALREQLAKNAKEEVITNKTWNKVTKDISRHYETLIKSRG
ncbi:MAG: glycosyltransferase family 4 protein [Campylobacteraceae bacterium]|nr:glycosyltransferase family 4 protein [Campylobacteraceae bacterium]